MCVWTCTCVPAWYMQYVDVVCVNVWCVPCRCMQHMHVMCVCSMLVYVVLCFVHMCVLYICDAVCMSV